MAAITTLIAAASLAVGAGAAYTSYEAGKDAEDNARKAAAADVLARGEQKASNAQQAALERRQQIREERVRRAKILQSAQNTGVAESSGVIGATGGLGTNLSSNIGANLGSLQRAGNINELAQQSADFTGQARSAISDQQAANQLFGLSSSIFQASGGIKTVETGINSAVKSYTSTV